MERRIRLAQTIDWWIVALYLIMIVFGWFNVYGASYDYTQTTFWGFEYRSGKQLIWIACALVIAGSILLIDGKIYEQMANLFYWAILLLLLVTIYCAQYQRIALVVGVRSCEFSALRVGKAGHGSCAWKVYQ